MSHGQDGNQGNNYVPAACGAGIPILCAYANAFIAFGIRSVEMESLVDPVFWLLGFALLLLWIGGTYMGGHGAAHPGWAFLAGAGAPGAGFAGLSTVTEVVKAATIAPG